MTGQNHRFDEKVYDLNAILHPGSVFDHPKDVLADATLSRAEKKAILASWASDAVAVNSNPALRAMPGKKPPSPSMKSWRRFRLSTIRRARHPAANRRGKSRSIARQLRRELILAMEKFKPLFELARIES